MVLCEYANNSKDLTQHPLFRQDPAALWYSAAVLPDADTCLTDSFADCPSTELDQLHQILSGWLRMLGHKHRRLVLEQVLLVLPCRQVPLETTDLGGGGHKLNSFRQTSVFFSAFH